LHNMNACRSIHKRHTDTVTLLRHGPGVIASLRTPTQPSRRLAYAFCTGRRPCGVAPGAASDGARPCVHAPALHTGVLSARASDAQRLLLCAGWSRRRAIADVSGELCLRYSHLPANDPPLQAPWLLPPSVRPMRTEDVSRRGERE
jgi:hypothetical protein